MGVLQVWLVGSLVGTAVAMGALLVGGVVY